MIKWKTRKVAVKENAKSESEFSVQQEKRKPGKH